MAELNSFYNGGLKGGSDVFAASLVRRVLQLPCCATPHRTRESCAAATISSSLSMQWSLDLMLSVANVGVVGTDFHNYERTCVVVVQLMCISKLTRASMTHQPCRAAMTEAIPTLAIRRASMLIVHAVRPQAVQHLAADAGRERQVLHGRKACLLRAVGVPEGSCRRRQHRAGDGQHQH